MKIFLETTGNAIQIQTNIAKANHNLISIIAKNLKSISQSIKLSKFHLYHYSIKTPVNELLMKSDCNNIGEHKINLLVF